MQEFFSFHFLLPQALFSQCQIRKLSCQSRSTCVVWFCEIAIYGSSGLEDVIIDMF